MEIQGSCLKVLKKIKKKPKTFPYYSCPGSLPVAREKSFPGDLCETPMPPALGSASTAKHGPSHGLSAVSGPGHSLQLCGK